MSGDLAFGLRDTHERLIPARLQFTRHQPVGRISGVILPEGAVRGIARRFEIALQGVAHLIPTLDHVFLRGDGGGDGAWADNGQERILDGVINAQAAKCNAAGLAVVHPATAAAVTGDVVFGA
jgi:hypothetical protein